jgi:hypothetical protein
MEPRFVGPQPILWQLRTSSIGVAVGEPSGSCPIGKGEVLIFGIVIGPFEVNGLLHQDELTRGHCT